MIAWAALCLHDLHRHTPRLSSAAEQWSTDVSYRTISQANEGRLGEPDAIAFTDRLRVACQLVRTEATRTGSSR